MLQLHVMIEKTICGDKRSDGCMAPKTCDTRNIARSKMDPGLTQVISLISNVAREWLQLHWLQIWIPEDGNTCIATLPSIALLLP